MCVLRGALATPRRHYKFRKARLFISLTLWVIKSDVSLCFSTLSTNLVYNENKQKQHYKNLICVVFNTRSENKAQCFHCEYSTCMSLSVDYLLANGYK